MRDYITLAMRTCSPDFHSDLVNPNMLHGIIGMSTEAGELLDAAKKALFYGKPLDRINIIEELGDILWYMQPILKELGVTEDEVKEINIAKLKKRYPEKFNITQALSRDLDAERKVLEATKEETPVPLAKEIPAEPSPDQKRQMMELKIAAGKGGSNDEPTY